MQPNLRRQQRRERRNGRVIFRFERNNAFACAGGDHAINHAPHQPRGFPWYQLLIHFQHRFTFGGINQKDFSLRLQFYCSGESRAAGTHHPSIAYPLLNGRGIALRQFTAGEGGAQ
ncbi:Uncharacterised protein [Yersinia massiliensis]|nr:Uncharacterised protein [Yersinia massiliensis]